MKNVYEEYAFIESKIKDLENQKDKLRISILDDMISNEEKKIDTPFGSFSVTYRKSWTYSDKVIEAEEKFKALKAKEESTGEATCIENPSLRFSQIKL